MDQPINAYRKTSKDILAQVNERVAPYVVVQRQGGQCAVFLNNEKISGWANRGKAIDKAFELKNKV